MSIRQMAEVVQPVGWRLHSNSSTQKLLLNGWGNRFLGLFRQMVLLILVFTGINTLLFAYMQAFSLPGTTVNGIDYGLSSRQSLFAALDKDLESATVLIQGLSSSEKMSVPLKNLGIRIDNAATWDQQNEITAFWTLPIFRLMTNSMIDYQPVYTVDENQLNEYLSGIVTAEKTDPKNAKVGISGKKVEITPETMGYEVSAETVAAKIVTQLERNSGTSLEISPKRVLAAVTTSDLEAAAANLENIIAAGGVAIKHNSKQLSNLNTKQLAAIVAVDANGDLTLTKTALNTWLDEFIRPEVERPAKLKRQTRQNGKLVTLSKGKDGILLDSKKTRQAIINSLNSGQSTAVVATKKDKAQAIIDGQYPKTSQGLHALIADYNKRTSGEYNVVVQQLRGGDLSARYQSHAPIVPASTYKAFLSVAALHEIENGRLKMATRIGPGTVEECMFIMVHYSTNICAHAIQNKIGAAKVDKILAKLGFNSTQLNNAATDGDKWTTPYDEYKLFKGLYEGTLLNKKHTKHLLGLFENQMYRSGIPAASAPDKVADKIGFLGYLTHDSALVYGDDYDYSLVIMTKGGSFWSINSLAKEINTFFREAT
ncbi:MAG: serine hydrolase [Candidatus Saccharimonadales bacterium]|nr:serine hydrolase [Candidatus Saccharimonadales bacterium]